MKILALILARGGSKRIPRKNLQEVGGKTLIQRTLESVKGVGDICDILVSTDNKEIGEIAQQNGALVPWLRPKNLSGDRVSSVDSALHALDYYEGRNGSVDALLLLQPTSPFRSKRQVSKGITLFKNGSNKSIVGVTLVNQHPYWTYRIEKNKLIPFVNDGTASIRSQDLPKVFIPTGSFYLISPSELRNYQSFITENSIPLIITNPSEAIDIDTDWDLKIAKLISSLEVQ